MVEDSGVGIPEDKREAMFEPFVRGSEKRGEGLGLGLSLVQRICENQGWSVTLSTMEPNGCRFHVQLKSGQRLTVSPAVILPEIAVIRRRWPA